MKPVETLTDEELRVEIAEFCGWKRVDQDDESDKGWGNNPKEHYPYYRYTHQLPNYPSDLNAMWEAEERLPSCVLEQYFFIHLSWELFKDAKDACNKSRHYVAHATAKQRAIAFVKTIREL